MPSLPRVPEGVEVDPRGQRAREEYLQQLQQSHPRSGQTESAPPTLDDPRSTQTGSLAARGRHTAQDPGPFQRRFQTWTPYQSLDDQASMQNFRLASSADDNLVTPHSGQHIITPHAGQYQNTPPASDSTAGTNSQSAPASPAKKEDEVEYLGEMDFGASRPWNFEEWMNQLDPLAQSVVRGGSGLDFLPNSPHRSNLPYLPIQMRAHQRFLSLDDNTPRASQYDNTPRASQYNATPRASQYNATPRASQLHGVPFNRRSSFSGRADFATAFALPSIDAPRGPWAPSVTLNPLNPQRLTAGDRFPQESWADIKVLPQGVLERAAQAEAQAERQIQSGFSDSPANRHDPSSNTAVHSRRPLVSHSRSSSDHSAHSADSAGSGPQSSVPLSARNRASEASGAQGVSIPPSSRPSRHASQRSASSLSSITSSVRSTGSSASGSTRARLAKAFNRHASSSQNSLNAPDYTPQDPEYWIGTAGTRFREVGPDDPTIEFGTSPHFIQGVPHAMHDVAKTSKLTITVNINRVIHGLWQGESAVFIGLTVSHHQTRVIETDVTLKVATGGLGDLSMEQYQSSRAMEEPVIRQFAPKTHYGVATSVNQSTTLGVSANLAPTTPIGSVGNLSGSASRTTEQVKDQRQVVTGYTSSEKRESNRTIFNLNALENASDASGIYTDLPIGLVIETRGKPVVLAVDVKSRLPSSNQFSWFRDKRPLSVPVYVDGKEWLGESVRQPIPEEISEWDPGLWRRLVDYSGFADNVSAAQTICGSGCL